MLISYNCRKCKTNMKMPRLPDAELEIMKVIWKNKTPISTSCIKEHLDKSKPWNVSALQTLINRLIERGFLTSSKQGRNRIYELLISEDNYLAFENKSFLVKLNDNSITKLVASLVENKAISNEDLKELAAFIEKTTEKV